MGSNILIFCNKRAKQPQKHYLESYISKNKLDHDFLSVLKQVSPSVMAPIKIDDVAGQYFAHACRQRQVFRLAQDMEVVGHQNPGINGAVCGPTPPAAPGNHSGQRCSKKIFFLSMPLPMT